MYIHAKTLEDAKKIARRENKNNNEYNQVSITSGKLHKKFKDINEYVFKNKYHNRIYKE